MSPKVVTRADLIAHKLHPDYGGTVETFMAALAVLRRQGKRCGWCRKRFAPDANHRMYCGRLCSLQALAQRLRKPRKLLA